MLLNTYKLIVSKSLGLLILLIVEIHGATAQDPQFTQFYASPLYLNPAFAGAVEGARVGMNYRNQWPGIDANYNTVTAWGDVYIEDKNSGVGLLLSHDAQGISGLRSTGIALQYAYDLRLTQKLSFRPGFQGAFVNRSADFNNLIFGDQFDANTGNLKSGYQSVDAMQGGRVNYFDLTFGGLFYSKSAWVGFTAAHVTRPNQSITGNSDKLPVKVSGHAGYKFFLESSTMGQGYLMKERERSIAPAVQYRHQGPFDQLDLGTYLTLEPLVFGIWYRGIPIQKSYGLANNESLSLLVGIVKPGLKDVLNIGYSYDVTLSKLGLGSGGAHEISITYSWSTRDPRKPPKDKLTIPCPSF